MVCLVRDAWAPFKESWKKSWERREELEGAGRLSIIALEEDSLVFLAALGQLLQAIKARDIVIDQGSLHTYFVTVNDFRQFMRAEAPVSSDNFLGRFLPKNGNPDPQGGDRGS